MTDDLWAHSVNPAGARHGLDDHLRGTAELATEFASVFGAGELAGYLGLIHDVGKGACAWQDGLLRAERSGGRVVDVGGRSIDHKTAGTFLAVRVGKIGPFALSVLGHHGGLPALRQLKDVLALADSESADRVQEAIKRVAVLIPEILEDRSSAVPFWAKSREDRHSAELLQRLVFSALVDADFLDTERHFVQAQRPRVPSLASLARRYEDARESYLAQATASPVDGIRGDIYREAVAAAAEPIGMFPFAAPTGAGKTIATGGFAVHHAAQHGLQRVIFAVPYLSITEQNASVYGRLFGAEHVLEHHSGVDLHDLPAERRWQRLASENWDAPVVVTTTVRLFESLFSRKPSAMRRLHRLAGAVVVLDEVQSLPDAMLAPILSALRHLTEYFGTSVVLASATQPEFFFLDVLKGMKPRPLLSEPKPYYQKLRRVVYKWRCDPKPTLQEVAEEAAEETQSLAIVNTTSDAATFHRHLEGAVGNNVPVLHLSTRMASGHRRDVLATIRWRLTQRLPVAAVSTQLVEAGVDLDFPAVFRAFAPAEALQQAAGRANRNGHLDAGRVVIFDPIDGSIKGTRMVYGPALDATRRLFGPELADPDDLVALSEYYRSRYALRDLEQSGVGAEIQRYRSEFNFPEVADRFKLIEERTVPVLVPYGDEEEREELKSLLVSPNNSSSWVFRKIQPYIAALPRRLAVQAVKDGFAVELVGDLIEWCGEYHEHRGIEFADSSGEDFVW